VLSDEAYFEMRYSGTSTSIAALPGMAERTVILYTFSKKYAMTGWRLGAPSPRWGRRVFAKLNTNDESCTTHFVQWAGVEAFTGDQSGARRSGRRCRGAATRHTTMLPSRGCALARPNATFYLFPDVTEAMPARGSTTCPSSPTAGSRRPACRSAPDCTSAPRSPARPEYARFAYSGMPVEDIREGLGLLGEWIEA
jgi:aspartate/methionine/tyrosine aminotransferase